MEISRLKPRKSLNKAFLKVKPNRSDIEVFKTNLIQLLDRTNDTESEAFHKNLIIDFLKKTYYEPNHYINTKGYNDLVIHNGAKANSSVGVIIETKKPTNKGEMPQAVEGPISSAAPTNLVSKLNTKALHELVLYYLRERITNNNLEVKHLVITNIHEWFIFDAITFDRLFAQNKNLVKQFNDFEGGRLADTKTDFFYKQIAEPFIEAIATDIEYAYFNLQDYQKPLRNSNKADDHKLIALYKLLSPEHLLKLPFANDSNSLDKRFYSELLHIIGLTETKEGSKKLIGRQKEGERNTGSILEDAIIQLDSLDKINRLNHPHHFGTTHEERLFNVALQLTITWVNRILFLKLLEAQLINYHKGDSSYAFLNLKTIKNYDDLNSLFFQVLARKHDERNPDVKELFVKVPYLNSSLFEPTEVEHATLFISNLKDDKTIPIHHQTVLKNERGKKRTGELSTLGYIFGFLNAYDFSSEGSEEIQEENKSLINASVLGLIFEKINGYKDGSFFTPGFITMYMCRETIRKAVVQKFNETKNWQCSNLDELYNRIDDIGEANRIVNSIKICDPAVGSGHFLVSALNEMIAVKNDLNILHDRSGRRLKEYHVEVVNDDLIITDEEGELFEYNPNNKESQRIQETLFHEKQTIIENCLFGVDINPNSVKICRLRLWIELLKNAYYITHNGPQAPSPTSSSPNQGRWPQVGGVNPDTSRPQAPTPTSSSPDLGSRPQAPGPTSSSPDLGSRPQAPGPTSSSPVQGRWPQAGGVNNLPHLKTFRKNLRKNLTPAEAKLWTLLKGKQLDGRKFRRQHSFANYILDFYCPEERLAIELDGQGHFEATQADYDFERDLFLHEFGIRVLRFENKWVWNNPEGLLHEVRAWFGKQLPRAAGGNGGVDDTGKAPRAAGGKIAGGDVTCKPPRPVDTTSPSGDHHFPSPQATPPCKGGEPGTGLNRGGGGRPRAQFHARPQPRAEGHGNTPFFRQLETLPNIDINIKCGNSLVSRFAIDADLKQALKKSKWSIDSYRIAVSTYRSAANKEEKREMERLIAEIKSDFRSEISLNDPKVKRLQKISGELFMMTNQGQLFEMNKKEKAAWTKKVAKLSADAKKLEAEIEAIKANRIFENAFEWRFEFPEVLNDDGDFVGFDVVIGNPPYIRQEELADIKPYLKEHYSTASGTADLYVYFVERGMSVLRKGGQFSYIIPNKWMRAGYGENLRRFVKDTHISGILDFGDLPVFEEATTYPCIVSLQKAPPADTFPALEIKSLDFPMGLHAHVAQHAYKVLSSELRNEGWTLMDSRTQVLLAKIRSKGVPLKEYVNGKIYYGIKTGLNEAFVIDAETKDRLIAEDPRSAEIIKPFLAGRDIKRYKQPESSKFLIFTRRGIDIEQYPAVLKHLEQYKERLMPRPKDFKGSWPGRKPGTYKWYEIQDAVDYWEEFEKEKIIIPAIVKSASYAYDAEAYLGNDKTTIIPTDDMILLAQLNSKVVDFYFKSIASTKQNGYFEYKPVYVGQLPIVPTESEELKSLTLQRLQAEKLEDVELIQRIEREIDLIVFEMFGLREDEIEIIEST